MPERGIHLWEVVGHVVSPFDLPVGGDLLVVCSLPGPPVLKQLMQMVTMVPARVGGFSQYVSPNKLAVAEGNTICLTNFLAYLPGKRDQREPEETFTRWTKLTKLQNPWMQAAHRCCDVSLRFSPSAPQPPASRPPQLLGPLSADSSGDEFLPPNCLQMKGDALPQGMSPTTSQFSSNGGVRGSTLIETTHPGQVP